ncbi:Mediator of RNA polymerase II transcription subunit 13 [Araneus ventricosus]|uniref:Mediator of RNA polymerase II transcription subunit 13 n=1 Tax=Araneus ventricosus TaxID=182803 RepID=A0A4Y2V915_ARAVE|nr:Mediator of RNA polymerase II transcription subunit 13 [Araneus ventricosus]
MFSPLHSWWQKVGDPKRNEADLNGIKWRRLCVDSVFIDPLEDPVLKSYSKCLSAGILTVWRKVLVQRAGIHQTIQESNSLSCFKELWIFWYGEGPDFSGLVESSLTEAEQGSWESGLSYECRTLLFKALHNLIERYRACFYDLKNFS